MYLSGKSFYEKAVCLYPRHRKFNVMFIFDDTTQAKEFYRSFYCENERMLLQRLRIFFCKHKKMRYLDVGYSTHHYNYCPSCKKAIFVDNETKEEKQKRRKEALLKFKEHDIEELKTEIKDLKKEVEHKEKKLVELSVEFEKEKSEVFKEEL